MMGNNETLKQTIQASKGPAAAPQALETVVNAQLHTGYRVVVYRMNTSGLEIEIPTVSQKPISLDYLLALDPSNSDYIRIVRAISKDSTNTIIMGIFRKLYGRLQEYLLKKDKETNRGSNRLRSIYQRGNLVKEYDITALVSGINTNLDIEGINTCNITCIDPSIV
jgi:hypothetical protein